jgi:hypothetical protein
MRHELVLKMESGEVLNDSEKRELFMEMGKTTVEAEELRRDFAQTRGELLLPVLKQQSLIRQIFSESFTNGQQIPYPIRSKKVRAAWFMASISGVPQRTAEADEIVFPTFYIKGGVRWYLDYAKAGNYELIEGLENDQMDEVAYKENLAGWTLIKAAEASGDMLVIDKLASDGATFTIPVMVEIITQLEQQPDRRKITDIYLSPRRYNEMLKWAQLDIQQLDDGTRREIFSRGPDAVASVLSSWGVAFHKCYDPEFVNDTKCYCFDGTRFGVMPVDKRWETVHDDQAKMTWEDGWIGREQVGFGITDLPSGCVYKFV